MPNGMLTPDQFAGKIDNHERINILYKLVYELYRQRKYERIKDSAKIIFGAFLGAIAFLAAHQWIFT